MSLITSIFKYKCTIGDQYRDKGLKTPEDILRFDNIIYGPNEKWNTLDVYLPQNTNKLLPTIINVHGGGWVYGSKEVYQHYCMSLAQHGFVVVNFSYRLSPKFRFPSHLEDVNQAVTWVLRNGEQYHIDQNNIFMVGDSAGAHTAILYTCLCTNKELAHKCSIIPPKDFTPKALGLNCGFYSFHTSSKLHNLVAKIFIKDLIGRRNMEEKLELMDITKHITKDFPPSFITTSTGDLLKDQPSYLIPRLKECSIPYELFVYGDKRKKPPHVFHCNIKSEEARKCNDEECKFFIKFMK